MDDDAQKDLLTRLTRLESRVLDGGETPREPRGRGYWMEKFLLPVTLALCTFALGWADMKSAERRADSEMAQRAAQDSTTTQLKYLELFYRDINNTADSRAQASALSLLYVIEPQIGNRLARAVSQNEAYSDTIRKQAADLGVRIENLGPLINYKVVFYFPAGRPDMELLARYYSQRLNVMGLNTVELRAATPDFLARIVPPRTYEIRHDSYYEDDAATQLQKLMHEENPRIRFLKHATGRGRTAYTLTVFLPDAEIDIASIPDIQGGDQGGH